MASERPSGLQQFLLERREEGRSEGEGAFTLAREKAVEKLAEFQLPFAGAWALKLVQAAVRGGNSASISIFQGRSDTRFHFCSPLDWSRSDFEDAFYSPESSGNLSLDHLVRALWVVGLNQKRAFEVRFREQGERLVWDGRRFTKLQLDKTVEGEPTVTVSHLAAGAAQANAEVVKVLVEAAYTCPVPLTLDSRRIDAIQYCPTHGVTRDSHPYAIGLRQNSLPELAVPQGTFDSLDFDWLNKATLLEALSRPVLGGSRPHSQASLVYLVSYHARSEDEELRQASKCYWVQDGVVVDEQDVGVEAGQNSVALFVSAEGIRNDLTTLRLGDSEERLRRLNESAKHLVEPLRKCQGAFFGPLLSRGNRKSQLLGGVVLLGSLGLMSVNLLGGATGLIGVYTAAHKQHSRTEKLAKKLRVGSRCLYLDWCDRFG